MKRPLHSRHPRAIIRHARLRGPNTRLRSSNARLRDALRWLAHEYEDDEEAIVGPGNDRADGQ